MAHCLPTIRMAGPAVALGTPTSVAGAGDQMPGSHITNRQVARYMNARKIGRNQTMSADSADISVRTARRLDGAGPMAWITSLVAPPHARNLPCDLMRTLARDRPGLRRWAQSAMSVTWRFRRVVAVDRARPCWA